MRRRRPGLGSELLPLGLILLSLAGTLGLVILMHRRAAVPKRPLASLKVPSPVAPEPVPLPAPVPPLVTHLAPPIPPPPPPTPRREDPTKKARAALLAETEVQRRAAREADRKAAALEAARQRALADSDRWKRREALVRAQLAGLDDRAKALEHEADALALERDLLARERDASKAALAKARTKAGGYEVLPNKSPNGTWQRPVVIECREGTAILQPQGLAFTTLDMSPVLGPRGSPLVGAVARELLRAQRSGSPDGAPVVPYIYFVVRPDGVRPYYEARTRLEPLGIAFGYELVDQDWEIEFPDFDALEAWDGSTPPPARPNDLARTAARRAPASGAVPDEGGAAFLWPAERAGRVPKREGDNGRGDSDSGTEGPHPYVWPHRPAGTTPGGIPTFGGRDPLLDAEHPDGVPGLADPLPSRGTRRGFGSGEPPGGEAGFGRPGSEAGFGQGLVPVERGGLPGQPREGGAGPRPDGPPGQDGGDGADGRPKRPANGRVRIDPRVLTEAAFDDPDRPALLPLSALARASAVESGSGTPPVDPDGGIRAAAGERAEGRTEPAGAPTGPSVTGPSAVTTARAKAPNALPEGTDRPDASTGSPPARANGRTTGPPPSGSDTATPPSATSASPPDGSPPVPSLSLPASGEPSRGKTPDREVPPPAPEPPARPGTVRVPLDLTVACGPDGVIVHPGGYRLSRASVRKDGMLRSELETIVRNHALIDATIVPVPRVHFLIESGGSETYWDARRGTVLSDLNWPVSIKVAESASSAARVFPKERF